MTAWRTIYHVAPDANGGNRWIVAMEDSDFRQEHRTKESAVKAAEELAREQEPSHVKVHKSNGNMEYEMSYGDDAREYVS